MVSYDQPVVVNPILSQWLLIMVCIPEQVIAIHVPVVVHHGVLC
jgi:hypothetical protein